MHRKPRYQFIHIIQQTNIYLFIMFRLAVLCAVLACAVAIPAGPPPPGPYHPAPAYGKPPVYDETPKPYAFQYGVADDYSGANFAASEIADGKVVSGSYTVHLPDGRVQTVTYTADHYNGFIADVKYEGTPVYPEAKPYHPAPYKPAPPLYKPAL